MKVLYCRVSTLDQETDRQRVSEKDFKLVIEDKCSGAIPIFEGPGGLEIKKLVDESILTSLSVWQIDRLGRDLRDIIITFDNDKTGYHMSLSSSTKRNTLSQFTSGGTPGRKLTKNPIYRPSGGGGGPWPSPGGGGPSRRGGGGPFPS